MLSATTGEKLHLIMTDTFESKCDVLVLTVCCVQCAVEHGWRIQFHKSEESFGGMQRKPNALKLAVYVKMEDDASSL